MKYKDIEIFLTEKDYEEVKGFNDPDETQANLMIDKWNGMCDNDINSNLHHDMAKFYFKLYLKCKQTYPELFI